MALREFLFTALFALPMFVWGADGDEGKQIPSIHIPSSVTNIGDNFVQSGISNN